MSIARELYDSIDQKIDLEARNGLLQFDEVIRLIEESRCEFNKKNGDPSRRRPTFVEAQLDSSVWRW